MHPRTRTVVEKFHDKRNPFRYSGSRFPLNHTTFSSNLSPVEIEVARSVHSPDSLPLYTPQGMQNAAIPLLERAYSARVAVFGESHDESVSSFTQLENARYYASALFSDTVEVLRFKRLRCYARSRGLVEDSSVYFCF